MNGMVDGLEQVVVVVVELDFGSCPVDVLEWLNMKMMKMIECVWMQRGEDWRLNSRVQ